MQGDPSTHVFILQSGWVKIITVTREGKEVLEALRREGEVVGELAGQVTGFRTATVQALGPVRALLIGAEQFGNFLDDHPLAGQAYRQAMAEVAQVAYEQQRSRALLSGPQRLAGLLLDLTETCVGILVAVTCALSYLLLLVALPPVILLQRSLMHQQLAAAARTDPKTGLLNAAAWQREADAEVARAQRTSSPLALLLVDVDHFKRVNDSHGHLIGDEVLRALATELRQQVRESDVVGRFGGEEFTVLLPRTDDAGAYGIAERLRTSAGRLSVAAADARINVTVSIGVAVLGQHGNDLFELLAAADVALYRAKDAGRDQVRVYAHAAGNAKAAETKDEATDAYP